MTGNLCSEFTPLIQQKKNDSDPWCVAVAARYTQPYPSLSFYVYRKLERSWVWRCCRSWWSTAIAEMAMAMFDHMCSCLLGSSIKWSLRQLYPFFLHPICFFFYQKSLDQDPWGLLCLHSKTRHVWHMCSQPSLLQNQNHCPGDCAFFPGQLWNYLFIQKDQDTHVMCARHCRINLLPNLLWRHLSSSSLQLTCVSFCTVKLEHVRRMAVVPRSRDLWAQIIDNQPRSSYASIISWLYYRISVCGCSIPSSIPIFFVVSSKWWEESYMKIASVASKVTTEQNYVSLSKDHIEVSMF